MRKSRAQCTVLDLLFAPCDEIIWAAMWLTRSHAHLETKSSSPTLDSAQLAQLCGNLGLVVRMIAPGDLSRARAPRPAAGVASAGTRDNNINLFVPKDKANTYKVLGQTK